MTPLHRPIEERIKSYNSMLLLIPIISASPCFHTSWKTRSVSQENNDQENNDH